jgi:hypothetical protein
MGNNNTRGPQSPREGNSIFYIYFVITQKNYAVLYTIIQFTLKKSSAVFIV